MRSASAAIVASGTSASNGAAVPGTTGTPARTAASRAAVLLPMTAIASGRRADERQPGVGTRLREIFVLREKAVSGMDQRHARPLPDVDDLVDSQIAFNRRARPDVVRLVRQPHVQRRAVAIGVDGDRPEAELAARANHTDCDFSAIGDKDFHGVRS